MYKSRLRLVTQLQSLFEEYIGGDMGPLLVLVSPCFRENVYSCHMQNCVFLFSLDNLLQKKMLLFSFLEIKFQNGAHLEKGLFLTYFSKFRSCHRGASTILG